LVVSHFLLSRELFPDIKAKVKKTVILTESSVVFYETALTLPKKPLRDLLAKTASRQVIKQKLKELGYAKCFSSLNLSALHQLAACLLPHNNSSPSLPGKTIISLYSHSNLAHLPDFYEKMDTKNVSTERGEGFNATMKWILRHFSNHDLTSPQPFREVLLRWVVRMQLFGDYEDYTVTASQIARAFTSMHFYLTYILFCLLAHIKF
jgi:hypothetical protein